LNARNFLKLSGESVGPCSYVNLSHGEGRGHMSLGGCHSKSNVPRLPNRPPEIWLEIKKTSILNVCFTTFRYLLQTQIIETTNIPESWLPLPPTLVSYPCGRLDTKLWMFAFRATSMTSSMLASRLLSPYLMLSAMLRSKRTGS
jgi:hypothetical protein